MESNTNLDITKFKEGFDLIQSFLDNVNDFNERNDIPDEIKESIEESVKDIRKVFEELNTLIALSPTEQNISRMKDLISGITLKDMWAIEDRMKTEIQNIDNAKKNNEQKIVSFIKKMIADIKEQFTNGVDNIKKEIQELTEDNLHLNEEMEDLQDQRQEIEKLPITCALTKKENPIRRFMRIMTEKPELWSEVEVENKIYLVSNGEIRKEIPKESEENKEAIVETEKNIIKAKKKYSIFDRINAYMNSQVFTIEPDVREQKLNRNYLAIEICRGKIEKNTKKIEKNSEKMQKINNAFDKFITKINEILENYKSKEILDIVTQIIDEINEVSEIIKGKEEKKETRFFGNLFNKNTKRDIIELDK